MAKTAVYSWRLNPELKAKLEEEARRRETSVADLLEGISRDWLAQSQTTEDEEEARLRAAAMCFAGSIRGGDPHRAEQARDRIRQKLKRRHASSPRPS